MPFHKSPLFVKSDCFSSSSLKNDLTRFELQNYPRVLDMIPFCIQVLPRLL